MAKDDSRYRRVYVRMWRDSKFRALSAPKPNAQSLWVYLLTGPSSTQIPGWSACRESGVAEDLGWTLRDFRRCFSELERAGMARADWRAGFLWLPNAGPYNPPQSPNVVRSWRESYLVMPECALLMEAVAAMNGFVEAFGEGFSKAFREVIGEADVRETPKPSAKQTRKPSPNQEQEQEQEVLPGAGAGHTQVVTGYGARERDGGMRPSASVCDSASPPNGEDAAPWRAPDPPTAASRRYAAIWRDGRVKLDPKCPEAHDAIWQGGLELSASREFDLVLREHGQDPAEGELVLAWALTDLREGRAAKDFPGWAVVLARPAQARVQWLEIRSGWQAAVKAGTTPGQPERVSAPPYSCPEELEARMRWGEVNPAYGGDDLVRFRKLGVQRTAENTRRWGPGGTEEQAKVARGETWAAMQRGAA